MPPPPQAHTRSNSRLRCATFGQRLRQIKIPCNADGGLSYTWSPLKKWFVKTAARLDWGRIGLAWPQRGWGIREIQPGGLGDKQGGL